MNTNKNKKKTSTTTKPSQPIASVPMKNTNNNKSTKPVAGSRPTTAKVTAKPQVAPAKAKTPKVATLPTQPAKVDENDGMKRWAGGAWAHSPDPKDLPMPCFDDVAVIVDKNQIQQADSVASMFVSRDHGQCAPKSSSTSARRLLTTARSDWSTAALVVA